MGKGKSKDKLLVSEYLLLICLLLCFREILALDYTVISEKLVNKNCGKPPPGRVLFEDDFESGNLDRWEYTSGVRIGKNPFGRGFVAQISSSDVYEYLRVKKRISIEPGHFVVACWKVVTIRGEHHSFIQMEYYDIKGTLIKIVQPWTGPRDKWYQEIWPISRYPFERPPETRSISFGFYHFPDDDTITLIDDVKIIDVHPEALRLIASEISRHKELLYKSIKGLSSLPQTPSTKRWKDIVGLFAPQIAEELNSLEQMNPTSEEFIDKSDRPLLFARRFYDAYQALKEGKAHPYPILTYVTKPLSSIWILPYTYQIEGEICKEIKIRSAQGEYESASIVLWSPENIDSVTIEFSDLRGHHANIERENLELRVVKCWFQMGCGRGRKFLVPELLLKDDAMVKVDLDKKRNYLRLSFPEKEEYVPIDDPTLTTPGYEISREEFPVKDSHFLSPFDLAGGQNKQILITVKVPNETPPGLYIGELSLKANGVELGKNRLILDVLPFSLPTPKTSYDISQEFFYGIYYWGRLDPENKGNIGWCLKSEGQFRNELRTMREYGITSPCFIWGADLVYDKETFQKHLKTLMEEGFSGGPLFLGSSDLIGNPSAKKDLEELEKKIKEASELASEYGFKEVYFYGIDEATGDKLLSQRPAWEAVHKAGGKVIVSGGKEHFQLVGDLLDILNFGGTPSKEEAMRWHSLGHRIFNYSHPQTCENDALTYRRNYGLYLWKMDFDGECTYAFIDTVNVWNDFDWYYGDNAIVYPTVDGVVPTLALAGLREGRDDVRYATLLKEKIEKAKINLNKRYEAEKAERWLENVNIDEDLDEVRAKIIEWIICLSDGAGG